eukprot:scaffold591_cov372-Prasinococcus_capsulatus_cf.AAC.5
MMLASVSERACGACLVLQTDPLPQESSGRETIAAYPNLKLAAQPLLPPQQVTPDEVHVPDNVGAAASVRSAEASHKRAVVTVACSWQAHLKGRYELVLLGHDRQTNKETANIALGTHAAVRQSTVPGAEAGRRARAHALYMPHGELRASLRLTCAGGSWKTCKYQMLGHWGKGCTMYFSFVAMCVQVCICANCLTRNQTEAVASVKVGKLGQNNTWILIPSVTQHDHSRKKSSSAELGEPTSVLGPVGCSYHTDWKAERYKLLRAPQDGGFPHIAGHLGQFQLRHHEDPYLVAQLQTHVSPGHNGLPSMNARGRYLLHAVSRRVLWYSHSNRLTGKLWGSCFSSLVPAFCFRGSRSHFQHCIDTIPSREYFAFRSYRTTACTIFKLERKLTICNSRAGALPR